MKTIPNEPTDEILNILYDGLYRMDTKFGRHRARMRYLQLIRLLDGESTLAEDSLDALVYVGADIRFAKDGESNEQST